DGESGLPPDLPVGRLLALHERLFRHAGRPIPHAVEIAGLLGLDHTDCQGKRVRELSEGWRTRLLTYLALAKGPRLLVADEATAGLDPTHREAVLDAVVRLAAGGMAVLWVT